MSKTLKLFNTLSGKKEEFIPLDKSNVSMYVCGPTVYGRAHIGNARSALVFDVLYRLLKHDFSKVTYVRNITDVDDKINAAAIELEISIKDLTENVIKQHNEDMKELRLLAPTAEPRATEHMAEIIKMIESLIKKGHAYVSAGHVLFDVTSYADYGLLSRRKDKDEQMQDGARVEVASYKKNPKDFVLWKPAKDSDDKSSIFKSPWSDGRPGWHIECSAMSTSFLGKNFDIHGGGADLKFPHHENEIAQSKCCFENSEYAKYWVHNGFLTVNGEKMSKSLGNFITIRELLEGGVSGVVLRFILLNSHYRKPLDYNNKALSDAVNAIEKFNAVFVSGEIEDANISDVAPEIIEALKDDLNVPKAFAHLHELVKRSKNNDKEAKKALAASLKFFEFAGDVVEKREEFIPSEIKEKIIMIKKCREKKDFQTADKLRQDIATLGYKVVYAADGEVTIEKNV
jgi:cysteinyl-tRNA synthetase